MTEVVVVSASAASLVGVGYLLASGSSKGGQAEIVAGVGIAIVVTAWFVVHTVFTLRYARLYYVNDAAESISIKMTNRRHTLTLLISRSPLA